MSKKIEQLPGVAEVQLNFGMGQIKVVHSGPVENIVRFITSSGYDARVAGGSSNQSQSRITFEIKTILTVASGLALGAGLLAQWLLQNNLPSMYLFAAAMAAGGYYVYKAAINSVRNSVLDMNVLMSISSIGAVIIGEWSEAATVVFLFSVGNMLQAYTMEKTRKSIKSMIKLTPREAVVISSDGTERRQPVDIVKVGDLVMIKPGDYIPVDGVVKEGYSWVDQSSITGESKPVEKQENDNVFAGTLNSEGVLYVIAEHIASDSTIARMIHMVEEAQTRKAPAQQFIDSFARYYTPAVIGVALLAVIVPVVFFDLPFTEWFYKALVLLVISCPCALVISTPVSVVSAIGNAARNGILIKGGAYLEALGKVKNIAFDKTGTLTTGRLSVSGVFPVGNTNIDQLLKMAGAVERFSEHPVAQAVLQELDQRGIARPHSSNFISYPGKGAESIVEGQYVYAGNKRLMDEMGIVTGEIQESVDELESKGQSAIYIAVDKKLAGILGVADTLRKDALGAMNNLKDMGIANILMLSGDNQNTAASVAGSLGLQNFRAGLLPQDKVKEVEELTENGVTVMVGDGVNDAPALAVADVGIAMGSVGTDTSLETADIVLMNDELEMIPAVIGVGRKTLQIIRQNVVISVFLKLIFMVLTFAGISNLWMAVFADTGASIIVILNGMRLARFNFK